MRSLVVLWVLSVVMSVGVAHAEAPADVARKIVTAQLAGLVKNDSTFEKSFAPNAVVNAFDANDLLEVKSEDIGSGMRSPIHATKLLSLTAGGDAKVVWLGAEVEVTTRLVTGQDDNTGDFTYGPPSKHTIRITELAVADGKGWKVVAAQFARPDSPKRIKTAPRAIDNETKADRLAKLVSSPGALSGALAKDATTIVFGTDKAERAIGGPAAKKLVDGWKSLKLALEGKVREVRTATYGFVHANVNWVQAGGPPYRMRALMIATPGPGGSWTVRSVHYYAL